jgi:glycosyltransferase involved in cell wall biosynthesis
MDLSRLVCHLIDTSADTRFFRVIAQYQDRTRFPVMVGSLAPEGPLQTAMRQLGTPTFALGAAGRRQYGQATWRLARLLRREGVSVLHAHCFDPTVVGLVAARLAGVPFVFTRHHTNHNLRLGKRWHTRIDAWCGRKADKVIAVSEATRRVMVDAERVPEAGIETVYYGIDPLPEPSVESVQRVRRDLGVGGQAVCLVLARLHEEKGQYVLFDSLEKLGSASRAPAPVVLLVGEGPHREGMRAEVYRRRLESIVRFLGHRGDVPQLIGLSTVVVLPSLAESFPFALLEAMSLGKPIVASTVGGIPELVGDAGLLVRPGDPSSLAEAICEVLGNPSLARSLGAAGRQRMTIFSPDRMMRAQEGVYGQVTGREWKLASSRR